MPRKISNGVLPGVAKVRAWSASSCDIWLGGDGGVDLLGDLRLHLCQQCRDSVSMICRSSSVTTTNTVMGIRQLISMYGESQISSKNCAGCGEKGNHSVAC